MNWCRLWHSVLLSPKVQMLSGEEFKAWINLMIVASSRTPRGSLPSDREIAFTLRLRTDYVYRLMSKLERTTLVDVVEGIRYMHDWEEHQPQSDNINERVKRHRERKRNVTGNGTGNGTEQNRTEQKQNRADTHTTFGLNGNAESKPKLVRAPLGVDLNGRTSSRFQEFWEKYPLKVQRDAAAMEYLSVVMVENEEAVFACLGRYLISDQVARGVVSKASKWLEEQYRDKWMADWPKSRPAKREDGIQAALDKWANGD